MDVAAPRLGVINVGDVWATGSPVPVGVSVTRVDEAFVCTGRLGASDVTIEVMDVAVVEFRVDVVVVPSDDEREVSEFAETFPVEVKPVVETAPAITPARLDVEVTSNVWVCAKVSTTSEFAVISARSITPPGIDVIPETKRLFTLAVPTTSRSVFRRVSTTTSTSPSIVRKGYGKSVRVIGGIYIRKHTLCVILKIKMPAVNRSDFPYPLRTVDGGVDVEADTLTVTGTATFLGSVAIDGPFAFTNIVADTVTADSITSPLANLTVVNAQDVNANTVFSNNIRLLNGNALQAVQTDANKDLITIANTGIGNNVLATSPSLVTPNIGAASATSLATGSLTSTTPIAASSGGTGQSLLSAVTVGNATNVSGGATGKVVVQTGVGATGFITPSVAGGVLRSLGTGVSPQFSLATLPTVQYFTTGGAASYTSPAGCVYMLVYCVGAGGGGGGSSFGAGNQGAGGGGGGTTYGYLAAGTYAMTYGTGGAGGAGVGGVTGSNGTVSTFGSLTGNFGSGGDGGATNPRFGGNGGGSTSGTIYSGDSGQPPGSTSGGNGGRTLFTRGGRGGFYNGATTTATPKVGMNGGGGGGAASANTATAGAPGGNGFIVVHEFYQ